MPLITINALPFDPPRDQGHLAREIAREFALQCNIALEHVSVIWREMPPHSYAVNGQTSEAQGDGFPLLVELVTPDFHKKEILQLMLKRLAWTIHRRTGVAEDQITVVYRPALSGLVYDQGRIIDW